MDSDAAFERLIRLCGERRWDEARDQHEVLVDYLHKGGAEPKAFQESKNVKELFWFLNRYTKPMGGTWVV